MNRLVALTLLLVVPPVLAVSDPASPAHVVTSYRRSVIQSDYYNGRIDALESSRIFRVFSEMRARLVMKLSTSYRIYQKYAHRSTYHGFRW